MSDEWKKRYIRDAAEHWGGSLSALAKRVGVSSTTITRFVNDPNHTTSLKFETIEKIQKATGHPYAGYSPRSPLPSLNEDVKPYTVENGGDAGGDDLVPVFDVTASAGHGAINEYEPQTHSLAFPPDYLKRLTSSSPSNLAIISVKGESMEPTLLDGDIVLLDASKTNLSYDGLFVLRFSDALHVKRIGRSPKRGHVMVLSDNRDLFPPLDYEADEVEAVGKVLWYGRKV